MNSYPSDISAFADTGESTQSKAPRVKRSIKLIADFEDTYALGWRFAVSESFRDALDIKWTVRQVPVLDSSGKPMMIPETKDGVPVLDSKGEPKLKKKRETQYLWTQGKEYNFAKGSVIYDTRLAYDLKWPEALRQVKLFIQIVQAVPFESLSFNLLRPSADFSSVEQIEIITCTHEEFVGFLKTGTIVTIDKIVRNLFEEYASSIKA